jgi:hypothetical protein
MLLQHGQPLQVAAAGDAPDKPRFMISIAILPTLQAASKSECYKGIQWFLELLGRHWICSVVNRGASIVKWRNAATHRHGRGISFVGFVALVFKIPWSRTEAGAKGF